MPYISPAVREVIDPHIQPLSENIRTAGDLNYAVTRLALQFLEGRGLGYGNISEVIGTLHLVASEMERRLISEFEDRKIEENGDVLEYANMLLRLSIERRNNFNHAPDVAQPHG